MKNTNSNSTYKSNIAWFKDVVDDSLILRGISALECHGLFQGWIGESDIYVYAAQKGEFANIHYRTPNKNIDYEIIHGLKCTNISDTFNELIADFELLDEQPILEGLNTYYYQNGESFDGLEITEENLKKFEDIKKWALEYYE